MHHRRGFAGNQGAVRLLLPLALAVWQQVQRLDFFPFATLATLALNVFVFLQTDGRSVLPYCLSAHKVLRGGALATLLLNTFVHADAVHIYYNALSFLHKGVQLERALGAGGLAALLAQCCALTPLLYIALQEVGARAAPGLVSTRDCAVGFSGVIFALKVVCQAHFPAPGAVAGIPLPPQLLAWGELVAISLLTPNASFVGHLAGILAGLAVVHGAPLVRGALGLGGAAGRRRRLVGGRFVD
jgi:rhomboid domain-containing protein 1